MSSRAPLALPLLLLASAGCATDAPEGEALIVDESLADVVDAKSDMVLLCELVCSEPVYIKEACTEAGWLLNLQCAGESEAAWDRMSCGSLQLYHGTDDCPATVKLLTEPLACPSGQVVRKEAGDFSELEAEAFLYAWGQLSDSGVLGDMVAAHSTYFREAHRNPNFLPWHRAYLLSLERQLQRVDPCIAIPFWDWMESPSFPYWLKEGWHGHSLPSIPMPGRDEPLEVERDSEDSYDEGSDARSYYRTRISGMPLYEEYYEELESIHNDVHVFIGGTMASGLSPADPVFFLHHGNIDRLWESWQTEHGEADAPSEDMEAFDGQNTDEYDGAEGLGYVYDYYFSPESPSPPTGSERPE